MSTDLAIPQPGGELSEDGVRAIERRVAGSLSEVASVDGLLEWKAQALALEEYLRGKGLAGPMRGTARRIETRIGQLLGDPTPGKRTDLEPRDDVPEVLDNHEKADFRLMARGVAEGWLPAIESPDEGWRQSRSALVGTVRAHLPDEEKAAADAILVPAGRFRCVTIDPPWPVKKIEREERPKQGLEDDFDYRTLELDEIRALVGAALDERAHDDGCHVYLWTTHKFLPDALGMFASWGVKYECLMTWVKNVGITPFSWMYDTEHVLFGRIGSQGLDRKGLRLSFQAPVTRHSAKPAVFYERVCEASPGPRLAMFERGEREGFTVHGDEIAVAA